MFKIIIAGSRDFNDYEYLKTKCNEVLEEINIDKKNIEIVSGTARGADKLGEKFAKENNLSLKLFPANWDKYGKRAGFLRNTQMMKYSDALIAFWDGESNGTHHMIKISDNAGLYVRIFYV